MTEKTRICFVCLGNIIRSPLSEHIFRKLVDEAGVGGQYEIGSAGTSRYHIGESPDSRMRQLAKQRGLVYDGQARQFRPQDFERFDWVIAMDSSNQADLERLASDDQQRSKIRLLREFDPQAAPGAAVPDPYYGGASGFATTYDIVERSCRGLYDALQDGRLDRRG